MTSYGGYLEFTLRYVPRPGAEEPSDGEALVEIKVSNWRPLICDLLFIFQGNDITFVHHGEAKERVEAGAKFSVLLQESAWERLDRPGEAASREYLMMALADLEYVIIKAAHSELTEEAGISEITLDIGQERRTGLGLAGAVEECSCPPGYKGPEWSTLIGPDQSRYCALIG